MGNYRTENDFYIDEKFGKVPKGWEVKKIGECFDFFPTSSYSRSKLSESGDCHYIHYGDIHTKFHEFIDFQKEELPFVTNEMASRFTKLKDGDLIIADASEDYDGVGKAVEIINLEDKQAISGLHTLQLRSKENCFVNGFKGYLLSHEKVRLNILRSATGIKVYSVSKSGLKGILLPKPPEPEQSAIASILSTIDEAIKATENTIKATEKLKKSLMQNLLTGKLKPDGTYRTENEFYKDEKFGNVPKGWLVQKGNKITDKITKGQSPKWQGFEYQTEGVLFVTSENVLDGFIDVSSPKYLPIEFNDKIKNSQLQKGDILINIVGASIGRCAVYELDVEFANTNQAVCVFRPNSENDSDFVAYYFQLEQTQRRLLGNSVETARANLSLGDFRKFKFIIPEDKSEQMLIASKIKEIDGIYISKQQKVRTLQRLKKSLMQNLLTGKMRVNTKEVESILKLEKN